VRYVNSKKADIRSLTIVIQTKLELAGLRDLLAEYTRYQ